MLKKFFMNALSSFVGAWIALALFGVMAVIVGIGIMAKLGASSDTPSVSGHSILRLDLNGVIEEVQQPMNLSYADFVRGDISRPQSLNVLVKGIEEGAENPDIEALYIECNGASAALATLDALRNAVLKFKESGKKVYAYGHSYTMGDYFVASVADSLFLNNAGMIEMQGITGTSLYMKDLFDKLGIRFQIAKVGTFKSAVEPVIMNEMSAPARAQLDTLYGNMWSYVRKSISDSRKRLTPKGIDSLINVRNITFQPSKDMLACGLVDKLVYAREIPQILGDLIGRDPKKLNFVSPSDLVAQTNWGNAYNSKHQVAVLYACGEIADGAGKGIDFLKLVPEITRLADDDNVKGMVLRVNSPGGSVFGSDQIGEALDYFMSKGKPLAVSMGDYAASGGYWISCCSDRIFADPLTITGSIGIFGMFPDFKGTAELIGVHPQTVSTNPSAAFPSIFQPMDTAQLAVLQQNVTRGYDRFVARVAKGRKLPESTVRRIAEGRVWDAQTAVRLKLVDKLGSLQDAVDWVSAKAKLGSNYSVAVYPKLEPSIWDFIPSDAQLAVMAMLQSNFPGQLDRRTFELACDILTRKPIQARMPEMTVTF
ncbi:MAG: signal peptide peptidase SppA [Muribaculaceae bacterium]|nr:signal peptide peptidase SppA [Muribaculaceae bacterium]